MTITLLGTGGAAGIPSPFGNSRVSERARCQGGREVRCRSAANVDGQVQLDLGPDVWRRSRDCAIDAREWVAVVFTHADADHFAPEELQYALYPFTESESPPFTIYGNNRVAGAVRERYRDWPFDVVQTRSFCPVQIAEYTVTPVKANHGSPDEDTHNLLIESAGKTALYATDTGIWDEPTWEFLADFRLDALVLECTEGFELTPYNGHLDIEEFEAVLDRLRSMGTVHSGTQVVSTHHSDLGNATYEELVPALAKVGAVAGYDGLTIEV
jgi:phosphoribosyl 1,2-cyclic phosphate phosphodiesterase